MSRFRRDCPTQVFVVLSGQWFSSLMKLNPRFVGFAPLLLVLTSITFVSPGALGSNLPPDHLLEVERLETGYRVVATGPLCPNPQDQSAPFLPLDSLEVEIHTTREELMWHNLKDDNSWAPDNVHEAWGDILGPAAKSNLLGDLRHTLALRTLSDPLPDEVTRSVWSDSSEVRFTYTWSSSDELDFATALAFQAEWSCGSETISFDSWIAIPKLVLQVRSATYSAGATPEVQFYAWRPSLTIDETLHTVSSLAQVDNWEEFFERPPTCSINPQSDSIATLHERLYWFDNPQDVTGLAEIECQAGELIAGAGSGTPLGEIDRVHIMKHPLTAAHQSYENTWDLSEVVFDYLDIGIVPSFTTLEMLGNGDTAFVMEMVERSFLDGETPIQLPALSGIFPEVGQPIIFLPNDQDPPACNAFSPPIGSSELMFDALEQENAFVLLGENRSPVGDDDLMTRVFFEDPNSPGSYRCSFGLLEDEDLPSRNITDIELRSINLEDMTAEVWVLSQPNPYSTITKLEVELAQNGAGEVEKLAEREFESPVCWLQSMEIVEQSGLWGVAECSAGDNPIKLHHFGAADMAASSLESTFSFPVAQLEDLNNPGAQNFSLVDFSITEDVVTAHYAFGSDGLSVFGTRLVSFRVLGAGSDSEPFSYSGTPILSIGDSGVHCTTDNPIYCGVADLLMVHANSGVTFLSVERTLNQAEFGDDENNPVTEANRDRSVGLGTFPNQGALLTAPVWRLAKDLTPLQLPKWTSAISNAGDQLFLPVSLFQVQRRAIEPLGQVVTQEPVQNNPPGDSSVSESVSVSPASGATESPTQSVVTVPIPHVPVPNINFRRLAIASGSELSFEIGRRQLDSIRIAGKAVTFRIVDRRVIFAVPNGLEPGVYDLRIVGSFGTVTYQKALIVRSP